MKTATFTSVTSTTTASSMAASAVTRARIMKAAQGGGSGAPSSLPTGSRPRPSNVVSLKDEREAAAKTDEAFPASGKDSKQAKGRLNLQRMELKKDGSSLGSVRDSGFLSRPSSDAVMEDGQQGRLDHTAATSIQAFWRGYWTREHNTKVVSVRKEIRARRAEDHIMLLRKDLERNRKLYDEEKRLRILQMEAIRLLYQEVQVLKSQNLSSSKDSSTTDSNSNRAIGSNGNTTNFSLTGSSTLSVGTGSANNELNRTHELERTCASLQSQVSQLQETLELVSSAVYRSNSLDGANFDLTDQSDTVLVTSCSEVLPLEPCRNADNCHWGHIPHSLSPYPSEEEEMYYLHVPSQGAPTPPRRLQLRHHNRTGLMLMWQPSSCAGKDFEVDGNKHIIGYRVYVNDQLKAFICQKTSALVEGLNPSTTYKFYVKALSGFGESFESNIIMAKLAKGQERLKYSASSGSNSCNDSDKDVDSTEYNSEKLKRKHRKFRKSPRPSEKKKSSKETLQQYRGHGEGLSELQIGTSHREDNSNTNNSRLDHGESSFDILTQPKLHTHRRHRSRDLLKDSEITKDSPGGSEGSPRPGMGANVKQGDILSDSALVSRIPPAFSSPTHVTGTKKESSRKLPQSPGAGSKQEPSSNQVQRSGESQRGQVPEQQLLVREEAGELSSGHGKRDSPSRKRSSSSQRKKHRDIVPDGDGDKGTSSANTSPSCGSEQEIRMRMSPKTESEIQMSKVSPPCGSKAVRTVGSESSSMSETFTVEKANSFLESVNAITESALGGKLFGQSKPRDNLSSESRGHRRTRSRDFQHQVESSKSIAEVTYEEGENKDTVERDGNLLSVAEALRLGIGRHREAKDSHRHEGDGGRSSQSYARLHGHRRKKSRELSANVSEWKKEDAGEGEDKKEGSTSDYSSIRDEGHGRSEEDGVLHPQESREGNVASSRPVIDGRRRHSSGSRPNSPVVMAGDRSGPEEKTRLSVAELMMEQKAKILNKSSSLNSLSGRSDDSHSGSRVESSKRSPSIESLPGSYRAESNKRSPSSESLSGSSRADPTKRTISNESLLSGESSRGESSKRTHSNESLMSIRTDTSKRSHSNESLPGSARTDNSRKSPSNESLPESIREENEQDSSSQLLAAQAERKQTSYQPQNTSCRRTQSVGSAKDVGHSSGESSHSRASKEAGKSKLLLNLENITKNNSTAVKETKESLMRKKSNPEDSDAAGSKPPSDDERRSGRRSRNQSESDAEGGASDAGLPPRAPSDSSSGSHSDDNPHSRRSHRRTPSDHRTPILSSETDPTRPIHSPIIMEGGMMKKSSSSVRRNQSFHGLLPSKHPDTKTSPSSNEDISSKGEEVTCVQTQSTAVCDPSL